jgi:hypothetical protein
MKPRGNNALKSDGPGGNAKIDLTKQDEKMRAP